LLPNVQVFDSHDVPNLVKNGMRKPLPNLTDLPPGVQDYIAAQTAELIELKAESLGLNRERPACPA
jgi:transposase